MDGSVGSGRLSSRREHIRSYIPTHILMFWRSGEMDGVPAEKAAVMSFSQ